MELIGRWKISEINAIGMDFSQTWKSTDGLDDDPEVPEMQKTMAKTQYVFEDGGRYVSILLKDLAGDGDYEEYDDCNIVSHIGSWKEEDGRYFVSTEENGEIEWNEAVPWGEEGFELFGFFRIARM